MKCTVKNNQIKSTTLSRSPNPNSLQLRERRLSSEEPPPPSPPSLCISSIQRPRLQEEEEGLHLFGAALSFFAAPGSVGFFPWEEAADVFWVFSLGVSFCAAAAGGGGAAVEDLEACVGFEVELEGCRRRLPSSPAEDEWRLLLPPSSPIGGCGHKGQRSESIVFPSCRRNISIIFFGHSPPPWSPPGSWTGRGVPAASGRWAGSWS